MKNPPSTPSITVLCQGPFGFTDYRETPPWIPALFRQAYGRAGDLPRQPAVVTVHLGGCLRGARIGSRKHVHAGHRDRHHGAICIQSDSVLRLKTPEDHPELMLAAAALAVFDHRHAKRRRLPDVKHGTHPLAEAVADWIAAQQLGDAMSTLDEAHWALLLHEAKGQTIAQQRKIVEQWRTQFQRLHPPPDKRCVNF